MYKGIISGDSAGCSQKHTQDAGSPGFVGQVEKEVAMASAIPAHWLTQGEKVPGRRCF